MSGNDLHRLLQRQIRKFFAEGSSGLPDNIQKFVQDINETYLEYERERRLLERVQEVNAREINVFREKEKDLALM